MPWGELRGRRQPPLPRSANGTEIRVTLSPLSARGLVHEVEGLGSILQSRPYLRDFLAEVERQIRIDGALG